MKNKLIYSFVLLSAIGLSSCDEDFSDWANPQAYDQQDAAEKINAVIAPGADNNIICDNYDLAADSVEILKIESMDLPEGSIAKVKSLTINDNCSIPFTQKDKCLKVNVGDLDKATETINKSRASISRDLKLNIIASATTPIGEGIRLNCNDITIKLTPPATPAVDPNGYSLLGDISEWNKAGALKMQDAGNNIFTLEVITTEENKCFKIAPSAALEGTELDWSKVLGSEVDQDDSGDNFIVWDNPQAIKITKPGKYMVTLDMNNYRFTVKDNSAPSELYMTGSEYGWGDKWIQLIPVYEKLGAFWGLYYFKADEEVKFALKADWVGDFGYSTNTTQESIDLAGLTESGGNVKVGKAGWYLIYVNAKESERTIEFEEPNIYLNGDCTGGWDELRPETKFTAPTTADGVFTSPALIANGDIRMYVRPKELSGWWQSEFTVLNNKIVYRGNGGEQEKVNCTAGQIVTLNFSDGTGKID